MKKSFGERAFNVFNIIFMLLLCSITLYPYLNQVAISFNRGMDTMRGGITIFPRAFTMENYAAVFKNPDIGLAALISVTRVVLATLIALTVTFSCAYGLTRRGLPYRRGITLFLMIPAYISAGMIPVYILYRYLHLINSYFVYILPTAFTFYNMIILRSFLQNEVYQVLNWINTQYTDEFESVLYWGPEEAGLYEESEDGKRRYKDERFNKYFIDGDTSALPKEEDRLGLGGYGGLMRVRACGYSAYDPAVLNKVARFTGKSGSGFKFARQSSSYKRRAHNNSLQPN